MHLGTWEHHVRLHIAGTNEHAHLASVRFEHSVCRGSLMATYIILFAWLAEHSLLHWCQQCVIVAIYGSIIN